MLSYPITSEAIGSYLPNFLPTNTYSKLVATHSAVLENNDEVSMEATEQSSGGSFSEVFDLAKSIA